ncbi:hybrid sensor histidine kinase/response regulator transcription factor [Flexithrix dorotheae]|uniref:hybrid sensor histidine kinase/response regulator transcription factor n=1 Tax=Flexithrix dorotheae TaxID=70993 RepID=UPI0005C4C21B|nr:two-component regulator propeller domain-containing protein [Flexithrix dorotheae]
MKKFVDLKYLNYFLNSVIFFLISGLGYSQSGKFFTVENELSSSMVHDVLQDHFGFIWIATENGLMRYDASRFVTYKKNNKSSGSILSNFSHLLFEDSHNNLFIGYGNGLQQFNYDTDTFYEIPLISETGDYLSAFVTSILERKNGDIIISTSGFGIFKLVGNGRSFQAKQISNQIPSKFLTHLYEDKYHNLWVTSQDKGLFCYTSQNELINFFTTEENPIITITSFCEDHSGKLIVGSTKNGLFEYNRDRRRFIPIPLDNGPPLRVNTLNRNSKGDILVGTEGMGLKVFNPTKGSISDGNFNVASFDFSKSKITTILEDKSGNLWLGIYQKGVVLIPTISNNFQYIGHKSIKKNSIGSSSITSVYKDRKGFIWIGTDGDGIYKLDEMGDFISHFKYENGNPNVPATIMTIFEDSQNNFWLGSYDKGLVKMDPSSGYCELMNKLLDSKKRKITPIFSIEEDYNKNLLVGTLGSGLYKINLTTGITTHFDEDKSESHTSNNLNNRWINALLVSSDEKLYIGTVVGLGCLDLKSNSFISTFGVNTILPDQAITTLYEDKVGMLWIGSTQGLMKLNPKTNDIISFSIDNGLPDNVICSITEDTLNNIWVSTTYGISKMNKASGNFINYYTYDGLQGNEFNMRSVFTDKDGEIMFGGIQGVTVFNPLEIKDEGKKVDVFFTGFYIHDKPVNKRTKSGPYSIVDSAVILAETFNLAHKDNSFTIEFSTMEYSNPERIIYMYKVNQDANWITLRPGTNNVTFNNLSPGEYTFKVRAKYYNTYSNEKEISIIIHPVWFLTSWAKLIYFSLFLMISFFLIHQARQRYLTKKRMLEHIQEKKVYDAKLQFFINIAHEIRTPMTLIINPLKKLKREDVDEERQKSYKSIFRNSERILHLINQLMDIQKIDKNQMLLKFKEIEMVEYLQDLCLVFEEQAKSKHINLAFQTKKSHLNVWIDPDNFDKAILNILSNALKFTPVKGNISIKISTEKDQTSANFFKDYVLIVVSDNGIGIKEAEKEKIFDCFYQTPESRIMTQGGTGVGLHLTRSIVQLHHGEIWVEDNPEGIGCRFIIKLPLGNKHLHNDEIFDNKSFSNSKEYILQPSDFIIDSIDNVNKKSKKKDKILLVDDNQEILDYLSGELTHEYQISTCSNGNEALKYTLKNQPDLIVSDIVMPDMDGVALCQKIKQNVNVNHIPIILLTAKSGEEDKLKGLGIGADAYLTKPFIIEILKKTIQNIIRNRKLLRNNYSGNQHQNDKVKKVELKPPDEILLTRVLDIIGENIDNPNLNVEMLSHEIGISRVHLYRKLKELTNQSTSDFIRNIRLHQAATLLHSDKPMNVSEVAYAVGFTTVSHFSNAFKKFYGIPPSSFNVSQPGDHQEKKKKLL